MLDINVNNVLKFVIVPVLLITLLAVSMSKLCDTIDVVNTEINKLHTTIETIKKSTNIGSATSPDKVDKVMNEDFGKVRPHGEWIVVKNNK